jgi:hypothetical protein
MYSLEPRQIVWLDRGMELGAILRDLRILLIRALKSRLCRVEPLKSIK